MEFSNKEPEEVRTARQIDELEITQLARYQNQLPVILLSQLIGSVVVAVLVSIHMGTPNLGTWLSLFTLILFIRAAMNAYQSYVPNTAKNCRTRIFWHVVSVAVTALFWGGLAYEIINADQQIELLIIVMILLGFVSGSVGTTFYLKPIFLAFSTFILVPPAIKLFMLGQPQYTLVAILLLVYLLLVLQFEKRVYHSITDSIELRFKNSKLIENLTQEKLRAQDSQRNAEQSLLVAESANVAKSQFLAAASHDLRQPLHALRLLSATLESTRLDSRQKPLVENMSCSVRSLEELLNSLLDVSKFDAGTQTVEYSTVYLSDIFNNLVRNYASVSAEKGIHFIIEETNLVVNTDVILLERLLSNLISNALRYTQEGEIEISTTQQDDRCIITVRDTGIGISKEDQKRIFEEFVQLDNPERDRSKGIGLGLAIVERTAQLLELPLTLESELGEGTVFTVAVPLGASEDLNDIDLAPPTKENHLEGMLVLIVDDEISVRVALEGLLDSWGCLSLVASNGDEAEQVLMEVNTPPDVIVTDLRLRNSETGIEVIERINRMFKSTHNAVILTGEIAPSSLKAVHSTKFPVLHKPCDPQVLFDILLKINSQDTAPDSQQSTMNQSKINSYK